jgi:hypothetical protein
MKVKTQVKAGQISGLTITVGQTGGTSADNRAGGAGILAFGGVFNS